MTNFDYESYGIRPEDAWSSLIFVRVYPDNRSSPLGVISEEETSFLPCGYVLVIEPERPDPKYKLAAGHKKPHENPLQTALRELEGETGIHATPEQLEYAGSWQRHGRDGPYWDILFIASITESERDWMNSYHPENEGEEPTFFTVGKFYELVRSREFMAKHRQMLEERGVLLFA